MVAAPETPDLVFPAVLGLPGDARGVGVRPATLVLAVVQVRGEGKALRERPLDAAFEDLLDVGLRALVDAATTQARGDIREQRIDELLLAAPHVVVSQRRLHHPDAAINVVADRSRRDTAVLGVDAGDAAHGEAVTLVAVGHADGVVPDAGEVGRVLELLERLVLAYLVQEFLAREDARRHAHVALAGDLPDVLADPFEGDPVGVVGSHTLASAGHAGIGFAVPRSHRPAGWHDIPRDRLVARRRPRVFVQCSCDGRL